MKFKLLLGVAALLVIPFAGCEQEADAQCRWVNGSLVCSQGYSGSGFSASHQVRQARPLRRLFGRRNAAPVSYATQTSYGSAGNTASYGSAGNTASYGSAGVTASYGSQGAYGSAGTTVRYVNAGSYEEPAQRREQPAPEAPSPPEPPRDSSNEYSSSSSVDHHCEDCVVMKEKLETMQRQLQNLEEDLRLDNAPKPPSASGNTNLELIKNDELISNLRRLESEREIVASQ